MPARKRRLIAVLAAALDQEVTGDDRVRLGGQELPPGRPGPRGRWIDARGVQDLPHRGRRDRMPEPRQLALDPPMAPGFSRASRTISFLTEVPVDGRPGRRRLVWSHLRATRSRCQRKIVAGVTGKTSGHRRRPISRDNAASQNRSAWSHRRRPLS
jgi:hypothetical protein